MPLCVLLTLALSASAAVIEPLPIAAPAIPSLAIAHLNTYGYAVMDPTPWRDGYTLSMKFDTLRLPTGYHSGGVYRADGRYPPGPITLEVPSEPEGRPIDSPLAHFIHALKASLERDTNTALVLDRLWLEGYNGPLLAEAEPEIESPTGALYVDLPLHGQGGELHFVADKQQTLSRAAVSEDRLAVYSGAELEVYDGPAAVVRAPPQPTPGNVVARARFSLTGSLWEERERTIAAIAARRLEAMRRSILERVIKGKKP